MPRPIYKYDPKQNRVVEQIPQTTNEREITSDELKQKKADLEAELVRISEDIVIVETEEAKVVPEPEPVVE